MRLPIWGGTLRGRWWLPESRGKVLRVLGGTYEPEQTRLFREHVRPGDTVLDIGAHVGYYSLLSSVLAGDGGTVWAFEPNPRNCAFLRRHVEINRRGNVRVTEAAVSDAAGRARFDFGRGSGTGRLSGDGAIEVETVRLDDFVRERGISPTAVKVDVEGAEVQVLDGARATLAEHRPVIFLSTHGAEVHRASMQLLRELGYGFRPILGSDAATTSELLCLPGRD
ncbi:MAG: FkbM family methyltransferase [Gemmatimonadota bacterium]